MANKNQNYYVTNKLTPPPFSMMGLCYFERSKSPWHADAFPVELANQAPEQGERSSGWMAIDWVGNAVGYVADGSEVKGCEPTDFEIKEGPYKRPCAIENSKNALEIFKSHCERNL